MPDFVEILAGGGRSLAGGCNMICNSSSFAEEERSWTYSTTRAPDNDWALRIPIPTLLPLYLGSPATHTEPFDAHTCISSAVLIFPTRTAQATVEPNDTLANKFIASNRSPCMAPNFGMCCSTSH